MNNSGATTKYMSNVPAGRSLKRYKLKYAVKAYHIRPKVYISMSGLFLIAVTLLSKKTIKTAKKVARYAVNVDRILCLKIDNVIGINKMKSDIKNAGTILCWL